MEELGNLLTNDEQVVDFMNFVEVYELKSVHIHVKNRVDVLEIVGEVLLLLPPEDDDPNGHGNDHTEGDVEGNIGHTEGDVGHGNGEQGVGYAEGDIGHVEGDVDGNGGQADDAENVEGHVDADEATATKPSKKKVVSQKNEQNLKVRGKKPADLKGPATARRGGQVSVRRGGGEGSGVPDLVDEEDLQLSDFKIINDDDDLSTTNVPLKNEYMENWWRKFVGPEHHTNIGHEEGEEYYDSKELVSSDGSNDEGTSQRMRRYREFNESHDMRVPIKLEKGLLFADTPAFKKALKWYVVQHGLISNTNTMIG
jgi:hypothetical protein